MMDDREDRTDKREKISHGDVVHKEGKSTHIKPVSVQERPKIVVRPAWVAAGVLGAVIIGLGVWLGFTLIGKNDTYATEAEADSVSADASLSVNEAAEKYFAALDALDYREIRSLDDFADEKWSEGMLLFAGRLYKYRDNQQVYLFMGVDNDHMVGPAPDGYSGGQSDAMFLLTVNGDDREIKAVAINRNTMVPVDVYDKDGNFQVRKDFQICIQHGYGDGMKLSCLRSVEAVQRLFRNVPVTGYLALNMGGVPALNDAVGGVEITPVQSISWRDAGIKEGETLTLNGEQAYAYLRYRDTNEFASADGRLERQKQYITALVDKVLKNPSLANKIINATGDYVVASVDLPRLADSVKDMEFDPDEVYTIPGETRMDENNEYECYYPDELGMIQLILDVFYEPVG